MPTASHRVVCLVIFLKCYIFLVMMPLTGWHVATQVMYTIGVVLLLVCEVYVRCQLCCGAKQNTKYRALAIVLLVSCEYLLTLYSALIRVAVRHFSLLPSVVDVCSSVRRPSQSEREAYHKNGLI